MRRESASRLGFVGGGDTNLRPVACAGGAGRATMKGHARGSRTRLLDLSQAGGNRNGPVCSVARGPTGARATSISL